MGCVFLVLLLLLPPSSSSDLSFAVIRDVGALRESLDFHLLNGGKTLLTASDYVYFSLWEEKHASMHSKNVTEAALLFVLLLRDAMEIVDSMDNPLVKEANRQQFRIFGSAHLTNDPGGPWITSTSSKMTSADIEFPLRQFSLKEKRIPQRSL